MAYVTTPNLKNLRIEDMYIDKPDSSMLPRSVICSFLKQSGSPLETFDNIGMQMTHKEFVALLETVPQLEELKFLGKSIYIYLVTALIEPVQEDASEATRYLCPLKTLELESVVLGPPDMALNLTNTQAIKLCTTFGKTSGFRYVKLLNVEQYWYASEH